MKFFRICSLTLIIGWLTGLQAQVTTQGYLNQARTEPPGTLLSSPADNDSSNGGRTTSINYMNGWIIVGFEVPGSAGGSDLDMRVYDISNPENPIRRLPADFGHNYGQWNSGNFGWNAHGTAKTGNFLVPNIVRVQEFGGIVEEEGRNGVPGLNDFPLWFNRSAQAGPWSAEMTWYGTSASNFFIGQQVLNNGFNTRRVLANFDHTGPFGGGDWHPMFFGDYLIYAQSGAARESGGVVVYQLEYNNFDSSNQNTRSITPRLVGALSDGFSGYWPTFYSDGEGLYVVGATNGALRVANISEAVDPDGNGSVTMANTMEVSDFSNSTYPTYQGDFAFIHNRKWDMSRFVQGEDESAIVLRLPDRQERVDTSQMSLALGNLWLTGGLQTFDGLSQGFAVWTHEQAADTTPPEVSFHIPQADRTNYPRFAPLSFMIQEHTGRGGPRNGIDFAVREVLDNGSFGSPVDGFGIHDFSGVFTFTPDTNVGLNANATYQVDFFSDDNTDAGIMDAAGNRMEAYSFRFSTGSGIDSTIPLGIQGVTASDLQPTPGEEIEVTVTASGAGDLEYRFNFDGAFTPWSSSNSATHTYNSPGRPSIIVQVRDDSNDVVSEVIRPLVITPPSGATPTQSGPMALGDDQLWVVNPDANTVSVLDPDSGALLGEFGVGDNPRSVARDGNGRFWVTCHQSDEIHVLNPNGSTEATIALDYGAGPFGVCASPDGESMFVSLYGSAQVQRYDADALSASPVISETPFATPRALAVSGDGQRLFVTRFISDRFRGQVAEFDADSAQLDFERILALRYAIQGDERDRASGVPNYLSSIAISPDGRQAAISSKQDNIQLGLVFGPGDFTHDTTVRAVVSFLDLDNNVELPNSRRDFDNADSPSAVTYSPLGDTLFVTLQGSNRMVGIDMLSQSPGTGVETSATTNSSPAAAIFDLIVGLAPQGVLIDEGSQRLFVHNFMGRSVSVLNAEPYFEENLTMAPLLVTTETVGIELLSDEVLLGKQIFYNANDVRMSAESYISCATCHIDGGHDGQTWDFTGRGEGLRRTTDLRGRSGLGHGNVHWSANFDEIQDFEHDIRGPFGGTGFLDLSPTEFANQHPSPASAKTGLNDNLDALAAYVASLNLEEVPKSPHREASGDFTEAGLRGRDVYLAQNCAACHAGNSLTTSTTTPVGTASLINVGALSDLSGQRLGSLLTGIDIPTLHGLHASRDYLHHGEVQELSEVFSYLGGEFYSAEDASFIGASSPNVIDDVTDGGGGAIRGVINGVFKNLIAANVGIRFTGVDGDSGGDGQVAVRYLRTGSDGSFGLRVNSNTGNGQNIQALVQEADDGQSQSGWRWAYIPVTLDAGASNQIDILHVTDIAIDEILVSTVDTVTSANAHRRVLDLPDADQEDLIAYLLQLDGRDIGGGALELTIETESLPDAKIDRPYAFALNAAGASSTPVWSVISGSLPAGLSLESNGIISGAPTITSLENVTIQVADNTTTRNRTFQLRVLGSGTTISDNDLILHYPFDEGSGNQVGDNSPSGNDHTVSQGINGTWFSDGRFGNAFGAASGDGNFPAFFPANQQDLNFDPQADSYTFSVWVRTTATTTGQFSTVFGKASNDEPAEDIQFRLWTGSDVNSLQAWNGGFNGGADLNVTSISPINDGEWHLLTMVNFFDEGASSWRTRLYYDGATNFAEGASAANTSPGLLRVGDTAFGFNNWKGQLDDFRVYRRALSAEEVAQVFVGDQEGGVSSLSYTDWFASNHSAEQLSDPANFGINADTNENGISNLVEFSLSDGVIPLQLKVDEADDEPIIELATALRTNVRGVTVYLERSSSLMSLSWETILTVVDGGEPMGSANYEHNVIDGSREITVEEPYSSTGHFYRLRVVGSLE